MSQTKWVIIAELLLDSGTEYVSGERVRRFGGSPSTLQVVYAGTVQRWGTIEKSIPSPSGMPQISNARIRISDHYRHWRDLLAVQPARRRIMRITLMPAGASVADYDPVYVGEVIDVAFHPAAIEIELRDRTFAWLDEPIPAMVVPELYPDIDPKDEGGFIPFVFGDVLSEVASPPVAEGIIPLPHIGAFLDPSSPSAGTYDCYGVAVHPVLSYILYRRQTASVDEAESIPEWVEVDEAEYVTIENVIAAEDNPYGNFSMTHTLAGFIETQPDGTEIRADVRGIYTRGAWGTLTAIDGSTSSPPDTIHNQIDHFINMTFFVMQKAGTSVDVFDTEEIGELWQQFEDMGLTWDFATTEAMTAREWLGRFLPSGQLDMYQNRRGLLTLSFSTTEVQSPPIEVPVFKEGKHILRESFTERLPENIVNQIQGRYDFDNAHDKFASWLLVDSSEQDTLAVPDESSPTSDIEKIEKDVVDLYCIRDEDTASEIISKRLAFMSLGSYRQTFEMPAPAVFQDVEIAKLVAITHSMGIELGGYVERQAKILSYVLDLDELRFRVETILFPPSAFAITGAGEGRPETAFEFEDPAQVNPARSRIVDGGLAIDADADLGESATFADCQIDSTTPVTPNYAQLWLYGFPEPAPPEGQVLDTIEIFVVVEYVLPDDSGGQPDSTVVIVNEFNTDLNATFTYIGSLFSNSGAAEPGIANAEYSLEITLQEWEDFFDSSAANLFCRTLQWHSFPQVFPQTIHTYIRDCWIEYTYA